MSDCKNCGKEIEEGDYCSPRCKDIYKRNGEPKPVNKTKRIERAMKTGKMRK